MANLKDIPRDDINAMKNKVMDVLNSMSEQELEIATKSTESFALTIKTLFEGVAKSIGYIITYPIALALGIAKRAIEGFSEGISQAWKDAFGDQI